MVHKEKRYRVDLTESQLRLVARCVEDCHRFMCGQMELFNMTSQLNNYCELKGRLEVLKPLVTPEFSGDYGWNGNGCPNELQRKFIAQTYYLYREIYHRLMQERSKETNVGENVYLGETLICSDSGEPISVTPIEPSSLLDAFSDEELKTALKHRKELSKIKKEKVNRCRMCKHWGEINYLGTPLTEERRLFMGNNRCCQFFTYKNNPHYYLAHSASQIACEHFERKTE